MTFLLRIIVVRVVDCVEVDTAVSKCGFPGMSTLRTAFRLNPHSTLTRKWTYNKEKNINNSNNLKNTHISYLKIKNGIFRIISEKL